MCGDIVGSNLIQVFFFLILEFFDPVNKIFLPQKIYIWNQRSAESYEV